MLKNLKCIFFKYLVNLICYGVSMVGLYEFEEVFIWIEEDMIFVEVV